MAAIDRIKRVLMGIGLLAVLAVGAVAGFVAYVWWDTRGSVDEFTADTEYEAPDQTAGVDDPAAGDASSSSPDDSDATAE